MPRSFQVTNSFIEGDTQAKTVLPIKISYVLALISISLGLLSFGVIIMVLFWSPRFRRYLMFCGSTDISKATHFLVENSDRKFSLVRKRKMCIEASNGEFHEAIGFISRYLSYYFCENSETFRPVDFPLEASIDIIKAHLKPLTSARLQNARRTYGQCKVRVRVPFKIELFFREVFHPFFVFQTYSCLLWVYEEYAIFALFIWGASVITSIWNVIEIQQNYKDLRDMAEKNALSEVHVRRKGTSMGSEQPLNEASTASHQETAEEEFQTSILDIVPGDIIKLHSDMPVPCDCILLTGKAIVNESRLTGEVQPVIKLPFPRNNPHYSYSKSTDKAITIYEGTYINQVEGPMGSEGNEQGLPDALVIRTGFTTVKGQLIRSILYPKPYTFKFRIESYKFLGLMFLFVSAGYLLLLPTIFSFNNSLDLTVMWLDLITIAVPPSLPAAMNMATIYSILRLKKQKIYCISPPKMVMSGRVDTCVFDKTGTLTQEWMTANGFLVARKGNFAGFVHSIDLEHDYFPEEVQRCFEVIGLCHSIQNAKNKSFGDPMESQLFKFSGFTLKETMQNKRILERIEKGFNTRESTFEVERIVPFDSKSRRMSVVARFLNETQSQTGPEAPKEAQRRIYLMKGAPETLKELCDPSSIPDDFEKVLEELACQGLRVIALAFKTLEEPLDHFITDSQIKRTVDKDMIYCGFFLLNNSLKEKTYETIQNLKKSNIGLKVSTGDNLLTTVYVAKEAGIISKSTHPSNLITIDLTIGNTLNSSHSSQGVQHFLSFMRSLEDSERLEASKAMRSHGGDECNFITYPESFKDSNKEIIAQIELREDPEANECSNPEILSENNDDAISKKKLLSSQSASSRVYGIHGDITKTLAEFHDSKYEFLFTGRAFEMLYREYHQASDKHEEIFSLLIQRAKIFARMSPSQKALLISCLQKIDLSCAMIGDGANDTAALKVADVGIALSDAEASVSAPFSSKEFNISCIYKLLLEGRCSLSTNYQCFKYMVMYSMIEFASILILYFYDGTLSENQLVYIDMLVITPLFALMPIIGPAEKLSAKVPPQSLFSFSCFTSVFGQIFLQALAQLSILVLMSQQSFYDAARVEVGEDDWDSLTVCQETSIIFLFSNMLYLCILAVYMISKPFKKPWFSNAYFAILYVFYWVWGFVMILFPRVVPSFLEIVSGIPEWFRIVSIAVLMIFFGLMAIWEKLIVTRISDFDERRRLKRKMVSSAPLDI